MKTRTKSPKLNYRNLILTQIKEKYLYIILGIIILISGYFSVSLLFPKSSLPKVNLVKKKTETVTVKDTKKTYTIQPGDYLWKIAEQFYGSGYNAYDIAHANNIDNPSLIYAGKIIVIPSVTPKTSTTGEIAQIATAPITITGSSYRVKSGDYLWQIALQAYGDGYAWVRIARANNLANPDLIIPGQTLTLPR